MEVGDACGELLVHGHAVAVELELGRIEECLCRGKAGDGLVHGEHERDDRGHCAVGERARDVARDGIWQRGAHV